MLTLTRAEPHRPAVRSDSSLARVRLAAVYAAVVLGSIGLFLWIRSYGTTIATTAAGPVLPAPFRAAPPNTLLNVLVTLAAVLILGRLVGRCLQAIKQPPVVGEILAGILLGPSVLGYFVPGASAYLLPAAAAPSLYAVAQLGIVLYMFRVGLDLSLDTLRGMAHAAVATSHASIVAPFVLGSALALFLYPEHSAPTASFTSFALFMGVAMSVTAFPVLARILEDRGMTQTPLGSLALVCAAVDDVTAWCLLALVVGITQARVEHAVVVIALTAVLVTVMLLVVRPLAARVLWHRDVTSQTVAAVMGGLLLAAIAAEFIGVHAVFGAFLFGLVIPRESELTRSLSRQLDVLATVLLLPAYFAYTGMRTEIGLLSGASEWLLCGVIIATATVGKFGGTFVAARLTGTSWRSAAQLGILMNTRGLMELVVLNIGLDLGVLSPAPFTMMVLMAVVTTVMTTPILRWLQPSAVSERLPVGVS